jgi:cell division protein FtsB
MVEAPASTAGAYGEQIGRHGGTMERRRKRLNVLKVVDLALVVLIGWLSWSTVASLAYVNKVDGEVTRSFAVLQEESARTLAMEKDLQMHRSPAYIEKVAREDLLMSRGGDTVILFPRTPVRVPISTLSDKSEMPAFVTRIVDWVKNWF